MASVQKEEEILLYKGHPLIRKENTLYYGNMSDPYIVMMQILDTQKEGNLELATRISVQLQQTNPTVRAKERIVKKSEKNNMWSAMDIASVWLNRALTAK